MGGACGTYGGKEDCVQGFGEGNPKERVDLEDLRRRWVNKTKLEEMELGGGGGGGMDWIDLAQLSDEWRDLLNAAKNLRVHTARGISCIAEEILAFQKVLCSM